MKGRTNERILALHPHTAGIAFVAFDSPLNPVDWGVKEVRGARKNARSLIIVGRLVERLQPSMLILADRQGPQDRPTPRIRRLQKQLQNYAEGESIDVALFSRADIRHSFQSVGAVTRYEIAQAVAARIHVFRDRLPKAPSIWRSQTERLGLFDAASLAMTYYCLTSKQLSWNAS